MDSVESETVKQHEAWGGLSHEDLASVVLDAGGDLDKVKSDIALRQHAHHNPLRQLRREAGYTQGDISDKVGVSRMTCANYESGKHSPRLGFLLNYIEGLLSLVHGGDPTSEKTAYYVQRYVAWYQAKRSITLKKGEV